MLHPISGRLLGAALSRENILLQDVLSEEGVTINFKDDESGMTALHFTSCSGKLEAVRFLIAKGADPNVKDHDGNTPLALACMDCKLEVTRFLLVENRVDVNAKDNDGMSPLHWASQKGDLEAFKLLIENDADFNNKNNSGWSSAHIVCLSGNLEIIKFMLMEIPTTAMGCVVDFMARDNTSIGMTPFHVACAEGHLEAVKLMIQYGRIEISHRENRDFTALHLAIHRRQLDVIKLLLSNGADLEDQNPCTPLNLACRNGHPEVVQVLLTRGAKVNGKSIWTNETPLLVACDFNHLEVVWLLVRQNPGMVANFSIITPVSSKSKSKGLGRWRVGGYHNPYP